MSSRSYEARHRAPNRAIRKPRRLISGLALPTAAAAAVTLGATGAEVATSSQVSASGQKPTAGSSQTPAALATQLRDRREQADKTLTLSRAAAAAKAARSAERQDLAVRTLAATRAAARVARARSWQMPLRNGVKKTSGFGYRWGRLHAGEDFAVREGTDLVSMSTGTVVFAGQESGFGNLVKIRYWDGTVSFYAHMARISARTGQRLAPGQVVGQSGNTGHSTGPHLHLEIHPDGGAPVNPMSWMAAREISS